MGLPSLWAVHATQNNLHCIKGIHFISSCISWESNPWPWCCKRYAQLYTNMQFDQNVVWNLKRQPSFCNSFCVKSTYKCCLGRQLSSFWNKFLEEFLEELLTNVTRRFNRQCLWNIDLVLSASSLNVTGPWWFVMVMGEGESPDHF